jgi:phage terminase large subunit-like protein
MKNEAMITYYNAESGIVIVDVDPDGEAPAVVWHFPDEGGAVKEGSRI